MQQSTREFAKKLFFAAGAVAIVALVYASFPGNKLSDHRRSRQIILYYTLSRVDDPIMVLGDSITEASTLPRSVCGRPVLNAGLDGASTASDLGSWLAVALDGKQAALIVVALGTNDALAPSPQTKEAFADRYRALLAQLTPLTPRLAIVGIPPVQAQKRVTAEMAGATMKMIEAYNDMLPDVAKTTGAGFVKLDDFPNQGTIDGVHLNAAGYQAWDSAVLRAAAAVCGS